MAAPDASNAIFHRYMAAFQQDRTLADDVLRMQGFELKYAEIMAGRATEFMATIPQSDGGRLRCEHIIVFDPTPDVDMFGGVVDVNGDGDCAAGSIR